jgi:hypothetical protein
VDDIVRVPPGIPAGLLLPLRRIGPNKRERELGNSAWYGRSLMLAGNKPRHFSGLECVCWHAPYAGLQAIGCKKERMHGGKHPLQVRED